MPQTTVPDPLGTPLAKAPGVSAALARTLEEAFDHTSVTCHTCGARCGRPQQDTVVCPTHGELDADLNGARNIAYRAGLGSGQASAA